MKSILATAALLNVANIVAGAPAPMAEGSGNSSTMLNLEARSDTIIGEHYCGIFANADSDNTKSLLNSLSGDGKNDEYTIAAHGCYRVACHNTSGVYVCNDNDTKVTVHGEDVANAAAYIDKHCCYVSDVTGLGTNSIKSGQQFTQWGWNVVLGYADCKADVILQPSVAGGWGMNSGTCLYQQGMTNANSDW